jgi:putative heme iron utilization protein
MRPDHFDPVHAAKILLREARSGAIATLIPSDGRPYCSLVNVATEADGSPLLLISKLAIHTKNLLQDPRISLMLDERKPGDPLEGARIMIKGKVELASADAASRRYLARHPDAAAFASFGDFAYCRIVISGAHLVAGFGRIVDLSAAQLLTAIDDAADLLAAEEEACAHMNEDHADTLRLYATRLLGADDGDWRCVGCDPEGLDLQRGREARRLQFPERVTTPGALRRTLRTLADKARQEADARR